MPGGSSVVLGEKTRLTMRGRAGLFALSDCGCEQRDQLLLRKTGLVTGPVCFSGGALRKTVKVPWEQYQFFEVGTIDSSFKRRMQCP